MVTTEMPINDFLDFVIETANKVKYSSVLLFLSRTAENKDFQRSIYEDWSSLDDLSNSKMMIVVPRNRPHIGREKGAIKVMWNEIYNKQLQLIDTIEYPYGSHENGHRLATEISDRYKPQNAKYEHYEENPMKLKELQKNLTLNTAEIAEYFDIDENWIPSLIFLSLKTQNIYVIKIPSEIRLFDFLKEILIKNSKNDSYISFLNSEKNISHKITKEITNHRNLNHWKISFLNQAETKIINSIYIEKDNIKLLLVNKDIENFISRVNSLISSIPYTLLKNVDENEAFYHIIMQMILQAGVGFDEIKSEENTNFGRSDLIIILENVIYVLELKFTNQDKKLAESAILQIETKKYYEKYLYLNREIILIGIVFNSQNKQINEWKIRTLKS